MISSFDFWTREDKSSGRLTFMGWECEGRDWHTVSPLIGAPPDPASLLAQRSRCFSPDQDDKRATKHKVLIQCREGRDCEMHFLYRQRLALVDAEHLPSLDTAVMRGMVIITAWETLNRMHANALRPLPTGEAMAEARVQQKVCHALGEEAELWRKRMADPAFVAAKKQRPSTHWGTKKAQQEMEARWNYMATSCRRAGDIAIGLSETSPAEAENVLKDVATSRLSFGNSSSDNEELYAAWFATLEIQGKDETLAMARALAQYLNHATRVATGTPDREKREGRAQRLKAIRDKLQPTLSDEDLAELASPEILLYEREWNDFLATPPDNR